MFSLLVCGPLPKRNLTCDSKGLNNCTKKWTLVLPVLPRASVFYCANEFCRNRGCGGHLASIHSSRENSLVFNLVRQGNPTNPSGWIGGSGFPRLASSYGLMGQDGIIITGHQTSLTTGKATRIVFISCQAIPRNGTT
ncbi:galactose-specific lectin nattectin-like isoform X2 [Huso huso]|uniref:Galactose-specific lectin nattectin-like isoform X2 n=1 Tax=Huso huso TaxID=61971 RepID=A0ABR0Y8N8_HUSHU